MMTYEIFKEVIKEKFRDYLPEQYKNMRLEFNQVVKVNVTLDAIKLFREEAGVSIDIFISDLYEHYKFTEDLQKVLQSAAEKVERAMNEASDIVQAFDMKDAIDNIIFQLINTEQNKEMLLDIPNRPFQDLSIIYRWAVKSGMYGIQSSVIHNSLAESLGLSEEEMFKLAVENTRRIFPPTVESMNNIIKNMLMKNGIPVEIAEMMAGEMPPEQTLWVISNNCHINGAISMLYEDQLHKLAQQLGTDLYIMPSSVHDVIAVSSSMGDPNELAQTVSEINMDQVRLDERLSNQVYHYDKDLRKLSLATDTPNKRLDGIASEFNGG